VEQTPAQERNTRNVIRPARELTTSERNLETPGKPSREYSVTDIIGRSVNLYSRHFVNLYLPFLATAIVNGLFGLLIYAVIPAPSIWFPFTYTYTFTPEDLPRFLAYLWTFVGVAVLTGIVSWVLANLATGVATRYASDVIEKGRADLSESFSYAATRLLSLLIAGIITGILIVIGMILLIVPGVILFLMFAVVVPSIIIEKQGIFESLGRSRKLMGRRWLKALALFILLLIIGAIVSLVASSISVFFGPIQPLVSAIITAVFNPLYAVAVVHLYYAMLAKEGEAKPPEGALGPPI